MKPVHELLQYPLNEYKDMLLESLIHWANTHTNSHKQLQQVILTKSIQNWFLKEYKKSENEWRAIIKQYPNSSTTDKRKLYITIVSRVYTVYPNSLLKELKNQIKGVSIYNLN